MVLRTSSTCRNSSSHHGTEVWGMEGNGGGGFSSEGGGVGGWEKGSIDRTINQLL